MIDASAVVARFRDRRTWLWALALLLSCAPVPHLDAQVSDTTAARALTRPTPARRFIGRTLFGVAGGVPGAFVGGTIGYTIERKSSYNCHCDDPGLTGLVLGASAGTLLGSTLAAAIPSFNGPCTYGRRWRRAFTASAITLAPGLVILAATGDVGVLVVTPFATSSLASAVGLSNC